MTDRVGDGRSLAGEGARVAGLFALDLLVWLLPVLVLGGVGLILIRQGSEETVDAFGQADTRYTSTGWAGAALVCFAVAVFFGRGVVRRLYALVRSREALSDPGGVKDNVVWLGIAALAVAAGILFLAFATGVTDPPNDSGVPSDLQPGARPVAPGSDDDWAGASADSQPEVSDVGSVCAQFRAINDDARVGALTTHELITRMQAVGEEASGVDDSDIAREGEAMADDYVPVEWQDATERFGRACEDEGY